MGSGFRVNDGKGLVPDLIGHDEAANGIANRVYAAHCSSYKSST